MNTDSELFDEIFEIDGSLRDIYILVTTLADWQQVLDALHANRYSLSHRHYGRGNGIPLDVKAFFTVPEQEQWYSTLSIEVSDLIINCHFFTEDEIEFDIDPREIVSMEQIDAILHFMRVISHATGKEAILTPENYQRYVMIRVAGDDIMFTGNK